MLEFADKGLAGARVDAIAARAGVNKQLLYYYFDSKRGLYEAAIGHMLELTTDITRARFERESSSKFVDQLLVAAKQTSEPLGVRWQRLLGWEGLERGADDIVREDDRRAVWEQLTAEVEAAQSAGEIEEGFDAPMLALALLMIQLAPYLLPQVTKMLTGDAPDGADFQRRQKEFLLLLVENLAPSR